MFRAVSAVLAGGTAIISEQKSGNGPTTDPLVVAYVAFRLLGPLCPRGGM